MLSRISPVVAQHKKTLVPGIPQLNMCDVAVMVRSRTFMMHFIREIEKKNNYVVKTGFVSSSLLFPLYPEAVDQSQTLYVSLGPAALKAKRVCVLSLCSLHQPCTSDKLIHNAINKAFMKKLRINTSL